MGDDAPNPPPGQRKTYADAYVAHCGNCDLDYTANVQSATCPHWSLGDPREVEAEKQVDKRLARPRRRNWDGLLQRQREWVADLEKLREALAAEPAEHHEAAQALYKTDGALEQARAVVETLEAVAGTMAPEERP